MSWTILVLEDDPDLREALLLTLEEEDYRAHGASCGREALELAGGTRFDVVIADVRMEGPDGIEVLGVLKQRQPALYCIVMTGYAGDDAPDRALRVQVEDYLYKPFKARDLLKTIHRLETREAEQSRYDSLFASVMAGYQKIIDTSVPPELTRADEARHAVYRAFYVSIRSDKVRPGEAIHVWDLLGQAERRREQVLASPAPDACLKLQQGYAYVGQLITALATSGLTQRPRAAGLISPQAFELLYDKVKAGLLGLEELKLAPSSLLADPVALSTNPELRRLRESIWV